MRLIDADKFEAFMYQNNNDDFDNGVQFVLEMIDKAPTVCDIPDNATNGDVIKTMFPNTSLHISERLHIVWVRYEEMFDWWNAPYQKGCKE